MKRLKHPLFFPDLLGNWIDSLTYKRLNLNEQVASHPGFFEQIIKEREAVVGHLVVGIPQS